MSQLSQHAETVATGAPIAGLSSGHTGPAAGDSGPHLDPAQPAPKRWTVTVETVPGEDAPQVVQPANPPIAGPSSGHTSAAVGNPSAHTDSRSDAGPAIPASSTDHPRRRRRKWKGLYVKDSTDSLAGAPISKHQGKPPVQNE
ncbi:hypothetical protein BDV93DRAFT_566226 [Ceratobasidium sp. AG-I]|nr:hypothetical protein BDV93DRAFT_566226 [Ceratobasidium sp. AG-I]